ncbi:hypothetical protein STSP_26990 [Streptomyces jeddahensis]|uniref:Uncharacterized protein n=1 Tax=Streptomyces jeddahensis TaxID=1716141 RepID=A0A177HSJ8_9ACTN|nr:hypothetical protein STSP_26990 [Streptomyces jeddahensis]
MTARIEHLVTSGTFQLDGGSWEVDNNVWLVGDDDEVLWKAVHAPREPGCWELIDGEDLTVAGIALRVRDWISRGR